MSARSSPRSHLDSSVRPYPYARWSALTKSDQRLLQQSLAALPRDLTAVLDEAHQLLGAGVTLAEGIAQLWPATQARAALRSPLVCLWLELEDGACVESVVCELACELAHQLVDRVLGGDGQPATPVGEPLDDLSAGVAGYLAARLCAAGGARLRTRALLTDPAQASALLGSGHVLCWPLSLQLAGQHQGWLRIFIPERAVSALASSTAGPAPSAPPWLGALPLRLCAHAALLSLPLREVRRLSRGDVVVPERASVYFEAGALAGHAELHVLGSQHGRLRCSLRGRELVLETTVHPEIRMNQTTRIDPRTLQPELARLPDDAPIELCLELARFTLRLDELTALRPGQVLSSGVAVGERVTVSAAGVALARGELVDIDGEVGVRILELAD